MKKLTLILSMMIALIGMNANAAIYIVGDAPFGGWNPAAGVAMTANGDGTYSYTATISGTKYFVFADGQDSNWGTFNSSYRYGPASGNQSITMDTWTTTQKAGDNGAYYFYGSGDDYTITFNENTKQFMISGYVAPITITSYTVAGSSAALFGNTWSETDTNNDMTLVNGVYTWTKENVELATGSFEFKVVGNHDWGFAWPADNYIQSVEKNGIYNVTITFNATTEEVACNLEFVKDVEIETTYTVAGNLAAIFGEEWSATATANDMTLVDGLYTFTKSNVELTAGDLEFKVVANHDWNVAYPADNYVKTIEANGTYDVVITFNAETQEINCTLTLVEETDDFYTVAGAPAAVFGTEWAPALEANKMTLADGIYTLTKNNVELEAETVIEFKVVKNGSWAVSYPTEFNAEKNITEAGTYDIVFTFDPETTNVDAIITKQGGEEPEAVYTVVGPEAVFGSNWNEADEANDMVKGDDGIYTWTKENVELVAGFGFKIVGDHSWDNEWPIGYENNWNVNVEEAGIYTIVITYDPEAEADYKVTCTLTKTGDIVPEHYDGEVYIMGEVNDNGGWFTNKGVQMTRDEENNIYTATITTAGENIPEGEETGYSYFSFTKQLAETEADWDAIAPYRFGAVSDGDFWVTDETLGQTIALQNNGQSFRMPAGKWNLTLSVDNMTLVIEQVVEPAWALGDVNHDTKVDVSDVTALIAYILGNEPELFFITEANVNGDEEGKIDVSDVTALIAKILGN